ncbi:MAG TPA: hypothetical protein VMV10_10980 [Pirellulales bacterium]|nr:hypothetical protein [Pirellulales bacterium]
MDKRIEACRQDYLAAKGTRFEHFFCPILMRDEDCEVAEGHIVPRSLGGTAWVPQRKDVDNFFGEIESDFIAAVRDLSRDSLDLFFNRDARGQHHIGLECRGQRLDNYLIDADSKIPSSHTRVTAVAEDGQERHFAVKALPDALLESGGTGGESHIVIDCDYRAAAKAAAIKGAHLTCFYLVWVRIRLFIARPVRCLDIERNVP